MMMALLDYQTNKDSHKEQGERYRYKVSPRFVPDPIGIHWKVS
jgi:hypothetical protein